MKLERYLAAVLFLSFFLTGCSSFKVAKPTPTDDFGSPEYLDISNHNFFHEGPELPLQEIDRISLTAAPIENIFAIGESVVMVTKNGRVYANRINGKKIRGKLKLENNSEGFATLHNDRYLIFALKLAQKTLQCYDLIRGKYLWKVNAGLQGGAPLVADSSVYVISRFKHASRYSLASGRRLWKKRTDSFAHTTPGIVNDLVVFGTDEGKVKALFRKNGEAAWETELKGPIYNAPIFDGRTIYISSVGNTVTALNPENGTIEWSRMIDGGSWRTPALKDTTLIVTSSNGKIYALNTRDGAELWIHSIAAPIGTSPVIVDDLIYFGGADNFIYAVTLADGNPVWQAELRGRVRTNPVVSGDYLLVGSENKYVYVFEHAAERSQK